MQNYQCDIRIINEDFVKYYDNHAVLLTPVLYLNYDHRYHHRQQAQHCVPSNLTPDYHLDSLSFLCEYLSVGFFTFSFK